MQLALDQAERAGAAGEVPVGAVLVESFLVRSLPLRETRLKSFTIRLPMQRCLFSGWVDSASVLPVYPYVIFM